MTTPLHAGPGRNKRVVNHCDACGTAFHPRNGREATSRWCSRKCSASRSLSRFDDEKAAQVFWSKVLKGPNCWMWTGGVKRDGYGQATYRGGQRKAHRVAYEITKGEIPAGKYVCHTCDNRLCVNPDHLWVGSHDENMRDMGAKRRANTPNQKKLSVQAILKIRSDPRSQRAIAAEHGIAASTVHLIQTGRLFRWLSSSPKT